MKNILFVEDDVTMREMFVEVLTTSGFDVTPAGSKAEAVTALNSSEFDIVISDLMLSSDGNGKDVLQYSKKKNREIPVLIITGYSGSVIKELEKHGADRILQKPFSLKCLIEEIEAVKVNEKLVA